MVRVLFVCMGNICRSPMAEAIFRHQVAEAGLADQFEIDSAGTLEYHVGSRPHPGTQRVLQTHSVEVGTHRARQITPYDIKRFHYVIAMDRQNLADMQMLGVPNNGARLLLHFAPHQPLTEVPDPYYDGRFEEVFQLISQACRGLLEHIRHERLLAPTNPAKGQSHA